MHRSMRPPRPQWSRGSTVLISMRWATEAFLSQIGNVRNIGISAHIDSGKTTCSERILFYTGKIQKIHEVKGGDDVGATMDSMELEKERGITIRSAATFCRWKDIVINLIDTPGHVDFTIEVERALRVLDGAILLLCGVGGVQSQTLTVDRQMRRYGVPRIAFINKLDRDNASPTRAIKGMQERLKLHCAFIQLNIGVSQDFEGVVDLIEQKAYYFDGKHGEKIREEPVPSHLLDEVATLRTELLGKLAEVDPQMEEAFLSDKMPTADELKAAIRRATVANKFIPVMMGSAVKNKGVQLLLDAVKKYLPAPNERVNKAFKVDWEADDDGKKVMKKGAEQILETDDEKPLVAMVFKLEHTPNVGLVNYVRVYQGSLKRSHQLLNVRNGKTFSAPKLVRMHANNAENIDEVRCGEIFAIIGDFGASTGDTIMKASADAASRIVCEDMYVPPRVISRLIKGKDNRHEQEAVELLQRFMREDPTLYVNRNQETNELVLEGMGELHLDIYLERLKREFNMVLQSGKPTVNYREVITESVLFDYTFRRQSGGQGQFAVLKGKIEPLETVNYSSEEGVKNKVILKCPVMEIREALQKSFMKQFDTKIFGKGQMIMAPVWGVKVTLTGGATHEVDSTDIAFRNAAQALWDSHLRMCKPTLIEPWMDVEITCPSHCMSDVQSEFVRRDGVVLDARVDAHEAVLQGETALDTMFGFIITLRSLTKGIGDFSMTFKDYRPMPQYKAQERITERNQQLQRPNFLLNASSE